MQRKISDLRFIADQDNGYYVSMNMGNTPKEYFFKSMDSAYKFHKKMLEREMKTWSM